MGRQKWVGDERKNKENGEEWRSKQWRVKTEERVMKIEEGELSQGRGWIKSRFFFCNWATIPSYIYDGIVAQL